MFKLELQEDIHNQLIGFFGLMGFSSEELVKIDTLFSELAGEYIYINSDKCKGHFFVEDKFVHMVLDCKLAQDKLIKKMQGYFIFPK